MKDIFSLFMMIAIILSVGVISNAYATEHELPPGVKDMIEGKVPFFVEDGVEINELSRVCDEASRAWDECLMDDCLRVRDNCNWENEVFCQEELDQCWTENKKCAEKEVKMSKECGYNDEYISQEENVAQEESGGCLIATATFGSELAPQVQQLRELRDNQLLKTESGTSFMESFNNFYYSFSPLISDYERENPVFRETVKIAITPMISSLSILNYVEIDSEESVVGYGISLILLNIGMYIGIPAIVIVGIRKQLKNK
jgi:hypothetical protein